MSRKVFSTACHCERTERSVLQRSRRTAKQSPIKQVNIGTRGLFTCLHRRCRSSRKTRSSHIVPMSFGNDMLKQSLLAEDVELNIMTIGGFLESQGYNMIYALNGREAIEKAREHVPALILMNVQMPGMDGLEATRRLRADPQFATVPIIALTAMAMTGDRDRCLEAGATDYVSKPVSLKELAGLSRKLLGNAPQIMR
ncbi:MAG: response regulator [Chloroflexi bacterium]|nr:MAG: response regulator [Chloroflexota bacterium]